MSENQNHESRNDNSVEEIPNEETLSAMEEIEHMISMKRFNTDEYDFSYSMFN